MGFEKMAAGFRWSDIGIRGKDRFTFLDTVLDGLLIVAVTVLAGFNLLLLIENIIMK